MDDSTPLVQPIIKIEGHQHPFEAMDESGELPMLKSVGFARVGETKDFVSYVITSKGREIISLEVSEPNLKAIAIDGAKVSFVETFMNDDGL